MAKLYKVNEVSELVGVTAYTVRYWIKNGILKAVKVGKHWRIKEDDLKEFTDGKKEE